MKQANQLKELLTAIDHRSYPAYKDCRGQYDFKEYLLSIDHVQGDPFAAPSKVSIHIPRSNTGFPANGRTINSKELIKILFQYLPDCVQQSLFYRNLDHSHIQACIRDELMQQWLHSGHRHTNSLPPVPPAELHSPPPLVSPAHPTAWLTAKVLAPNHNIALPSDIYINYIGATLIVEVPDMLLDLITTKYDSYITNHIFQQCEFFTRQMNFLTSTYYLTFLTIHTQISNRKYIRHLIYTSSS